MNTAYGQQTLSNIPSGGSVTEFSTSSSSIQSPTSSGSAVLFSSSTSFSIYDISFVLQDGSVGASTISDLTVSIYNTSGGIPTGTALASVTGVSASLNSGATYPVTTLSGSTISPITALSLSSGTTYALLLSSSSDVAWMGTSTLSTPTPAGGSPLSYVGFTGNYNGNWYTRNFNPYVSIGTSSASPVPEASGSVAGLGLAVAGLYQLRRRRQNTVTQ